MNDCVESSSFQLWAAILRGGEFSFFVCFFSARVAQGTRSPEPRGLTAAYFSLDRIGCAFSQTWLINGRKRSGRPGRLFVPLPEGTRT